RPAVQRVGDPLFLGEGATPADLLQLAVGGAARGGAEVGGRFPATRCHRNQTQEVSGPGPRAPRPGGGSVVRGPGRAGPCRRGPPRPEVRPASAGRRPASGPPGRIAERSARGGTVERPAATRTAGGPIPRCRPLWGAVARGGPGASRLRGGHVRRCGP